VAMGMHQAIPAWFEAAFSMTSISFLPSNKLLQSRVGPGAADMRRLYFSSATWQVKNA